MTRKQKRKPIEEQPVESNLEERPKELYMLRAVPEGCWVNTGEDFHSLVCMTTLPAAVKAAVQLARWKLHCEPVRIWLKGDTPPEAKSEANRKYLPQQQELFTAEQE